MEMPAQGGHDMLTSDARERLCVLLSFLSFLSPVRLGGVHEGGGKRVIGDECGAEACYRENANVVQCSHWAENKNEEHSAKNEGGHAHGLADFAIREQ